MSSAQETFAQMLKEELAPRLRAIGFKGSGQSFSIAHDTHWISLGFQKSQWSTRDVVSFTANLTVVSKTEWDAARQQRPFLPPKPQPNTMYSREWSMRIGQLLPSGGDKWWDVRADSPDTAELAIFIASAVHDHVLPAIRERVGET